MQPWCVQIAEYAKTPVFVRNKNAGDPFAATNFWLEPIGNLETLTIRFGEEAIADCVRPKISAPAAIAAERKKPLRFISLSPNRYAVVKDNDLT